MSGHAIRRQAKAIRRLEARMDRKMVRLRAEMVTLYATLLPVPLDDLSPEEICRRTRVVHDGPRLEPLIVERRWSHTSREPSALDDAVACSDG